MRYRPFVRLRFWTVLAAMGSVYSLTAANGADEPAKPPVVEERLDRSGDVPESLLPFAPAQPQTEADRKKIEASAHYMQGLILQKRGDFQAAIEQFRKALAADPTGVEIYRSLIVLALRFNDRTMAENLLVEALKHAPNDLQMLRLLGAIYEERQQAPLAIELLERASKSPDLKPDSQEQILLMIELGLLYRSVGEKQKAADAYTVILKAVEHPERYNLGTGPAAALLKNPELSLERIGSVFLEAERYDDALRAFDLAEKKPQLKPEEINFFRAKIFFAQKKHDAALEKLRTYLDKKLQSQGIEPYQLFASIMEATGRENEVEPELEKLSDGDPGNNFVLYALADYYLAQDDLTKAERFYLKAIARGADPEGYRGLMGLYLRQKSAGDWLGALSGLLGLGKNTPGIDDHFKLVSSDADFLAAINAEARKLKESGSKKFDFPEAYVLGRLSAAAKQTPTAIEFYRLSMEFRPAQKQQLYLELGQYLLENDAFAELEALMEEALSTPTNAALRLRYSQTLAQALIQHSFDLDKEGQSDAALVKVDRANELLPDNPIVMFRKGWLLYRVERWQDSIDALQSIIDKFGNEPSEQLQDIVRRSHFIMSTVYVHKGDMRKGEEILEKIYEQDPDDPSVNNDLGYLYADHNKNLDQAEKMIRKAVAAEPDNQAYQDSLGWVLYRKGNYDEALKWLLMAVKDSEEGDATLWDHLGDVYDKLGQAEKARESWQTALKQAEAEKRQDAKLLRAIREKLGLAPEDKPLSAPTPPGNPE